MALQNRNRAARSLTAPKTLPEVLLKAAQYNNKQGIGYAKPGQEIRFETYSALYQKACKLAAGLQSIGFRKGDKVILACNTNEEIIPIFWACALLGLIPSILQPPVAYSEINPAAIKLIKVYKLLKNAKVIFSDPLAEKWEATSIPQSAILGVSEIPSLETAVEFPDYQSTDIAYIQFSSGSTGNPKGIQLTHANFITNMDAIAYGLDFNTNDITTNWMPLYHDMGFVGYHLTPMYFPFNQYHINSADFIMRPFVWLDVMSKTRTTITGCPNFGQSLMLRHLQKQHNKQWDLSAIKALLNGAEPISIRIMRDFMEALAPHHFAPEAMMPVYGMAEATLAISFSDLRAVPLIKKIDRDRFQHQNIATEIHSADESFIEIASVGKALNDIEIRVVDQADQVLEEGQIGHIQICGEGVTKGYYDPASNHHKAFCDNWLRTGDLGFYLQDELYITGRYKDIIFQNGQNLFANDLEFIAQQLDEVGFGKVVIGGFTDSQRGGEQIALFLAGSKSLHKTETYQKINAHFKNTIGVTIDLFIPIRPNQIPKTSSGKIQRYKMIEQLLQGEFDTIKIAATSL